MAVCVDSAGDSPCWTISIPSRTEATSAVACCGRRPQARVRLRLSDGGEDELSLPISVGKEVARRQADGRLCPVSAKELVLSLQELQEAHAARRVRRLLERRDYSSKELRDKLAADGYWPEVIEDGIGRLQETGLVDDARYADVFMRSKLCAGWGPSKVEQALARRGIDARCIVGWPDAYLPEGGEAQQAYQVARGRCHGGKDPYAKVVRFLCTRGFALHAAGMAASRLRDEGVI